MRIRRRTYTGSLFPEVLTVKPIVQALPATAKRKRKLKSFTANPRGNRATKKKKCIRNWDLYIPTELLSEILSRLVLKANIRASAVCKTWCEAAVSVRKSQPRPWLCYPLDESCPTNSSYILFDPLRSQTFQLDFLELKGGKFTYSRDGWLPVLTDYIPAFSYFLNPFTRERINLPVYPSCSSGYYVAFSAAPTSSSCLVMSLTQLTCFPYFVIHTWRPGETVWTRHCFEKELPEHIWARCIFSNGMMFYWLSVCGHLGVFDPSKATWNFLPVKPCPADFARPVLVTEHEGDIFVMYTYGKQDQPVFKLNLERMVWEEKRELGGLTVFPSYSTSFTRAGLSAEERNIMYEQFGICENFHPPWRTVWSHSIAWVDPP